MDVAQVSLIEILKGIAKLTRLKVQRDKRFLVEIVRPIYENAEIVFNNYIKIFNNIIVFLSKGEEGLKLSKEYLEKERMKYQSQRIKIRASITVLQERLPVLDQKFTRGLEGILCAGVSQYEPREHIDMAGFYQRNHTILGFVSELSNNEVPKDHLPEYCIVQAQKQLAALEAAFEMLAQGFTEMEAKLL